MKHVNENLSTYHNMVITQLNSRTRVLLKSNCFFTYLLHYMRSQVDLLNVWLIINVVENASLLTLIVLYYIMASIKACKSATISLPR